MKIYYFACVIVLGLTFNSCTTDEIETTNSKQTQNMNSTVLNDDSTASLDGEPVVPKGKDN